MRSLAYREGLAARGAEVPAWENPYEPGSPEFIQWRDGWWRAAAQMRDAEQKELLARRNEE